MGGVKNKFLTWLAITNVFAFIIIFILFWMLLENSSMFQQQRDNITVNYVPQPALTRPPEREIPEPGPVEPSVNEEDLSIITAVAKEVKSNKLEANLGLGATSKTSAKAATTKDNAGDLSDEQYIASYQQITNKQPVAKKEISEKEATTVKATAKPADSPVSALNRFNKVDLSKRKKTASNITSLAEQVSQIAIIENEQEIVNSARSANADNTRYLTSLKQAAVERQNEMRTITVRRGDTLWKISTRAYGTGFLYHKVFEANPHLTSPDDITVGETLRVPL